MRGGDARKQLMALQMRRRGLAVNTKFIATFVAVLALLAQPIGTMLRTNVAHAASAHTVVTTSLSTWYLGETRSAGHNQLVSGGLHVWTEPSGGSYANEFSKAAGYYGASLALADAGAPSIEFASYSGVRPSLQLGVDKDGNGSWDGYLVYEPWAYGDGQWWTSKNFGLTAGGGYTNMGTLAQYSAANPHAKIISLGYSLGSGVVGDAVISQLTVGDTDYTFDLPAAPAAPVNLRLNGDKPCGFITNVNSITPTWDAVPGAASYNYKVTVPSGAQYGPINLGNVTSVTGPFGGEGLSTFSVQAVGSDGQTSAWAPDCAVTYDATAPATPVHASPADNAVINTNDFWFDWNDVAGAASYEMQNSQNPAVDASGSFANVQWTGDYQQIQPTESKARSVGANGTWYWQVRAVDAAGNKSAWTTPWKITIDMQAPAAPVLSVKASDGTVLTSGAYANKYSITANWSEASTDAVKYLYKYWNAIPGNPYDAAHPYVVETTSMSQSGVFNQGEGTHYMQIFAVDAAGNVSAGSNVFEVKYDATKPTVLGERVDTNTFKVTAADLALNKVVANLYKVGQSGVFKPYQTSSSNTLTIDLSTLAAGDYYIKYNATDKAGNLSTTNTYEFTIAAPVTNISNTNTTTSTTSSGGTSTTGQVAGTNTTSSNNTQSPAPGQGGGAASSGTSSQQSTASVDAAGVSSTTDPEVLSAQTADNVKDNTKSTTDPTGYVADASTQNTGGFAWYWWLVVAAAVVAALWAIIAAVRRRSFEA